jgi:D-sedoheptulose 7-phosphate isomerase
MVLAQRAPQVTAAALPSGDVAEALEERARALFAALSLVAKESDGIAGAAALIHEALASGHKVLVCGNGGSAAEAQHFVGELVGRFRREREPWPALALTADATVVTAIANDYGFETVFARQVAAFGGAGDVLVGLSTSGESPNVVNAAAEARVRGMRVVALTGNRPSRLGALADAEIAVPASETALVQEVHSVLVHLISEIVESNLTAPRGHDRKAART